MHSDLWTTGTAAHTPLQPVGWQMTPIPIQDAAPSMILRCGSGNLEKIHFTKSYSALTPTKHYNTAKVISTTGSNDWGWSTSTFTPMVLQVNHQHTARANTVSIIYLQHQELPTHAHTVGYFHYRKPHPATIVVALLTSNSANSLEETRSPPSSCSQRHPKPRPTCR